MHLTNRQKAFSLTRLFLRPPISRPNSTKAPSSNSSPQPGQDGKPQSRPLVSKEQPNDAYKPNLEYLKKQPNSFASRLAKAATIADERKQFSRQPVPDKKFSERSPNSSVDVSEMPPLSRIPSATSAAPSTKSFDHVVAKRRAEREAREAASEYKVHGAAASPHFRERNATASASLLADPQRREDPSVARRRAERLARKPKTTDNPQSHEESTHRMAAIKRKLPYSQPKAKGSAKVIGTLDQDEDIVVSVDPPEFYGPDPVSADLSDLSPRNPTSKWDRNLNRAVSRKGARKGDGANRVFRKYGGDFGDYVVAPPHAHTTPLHRLQPSTQARLALANSKDIRLNLRSELLNVLEKAVGTIPHDDGGNGQQQTKVLTP